MSILGLRRGGGEIKIDIGNIGISGSIGRRVVSVSGGNETWGERRKGDGEATNNISAEKRDGVLSGDFFNRTIWFFSVALVGMGLLKGLSKIIVLIWGSGIEVERNGVLGG